MRRHSIYSPELQLLAETEITTASKPPIQYEYVWFGGEPLAQIETATDDIRWYFTDHLGTPILQTDATAAVVWRAEYDPYGTVFAFRAGADEHQPLRFPGQENDGTTELSYNIFRWYRAGWGRYSQPDPMEYGEQSTYRYTDGNPVLSIDPHGLYTKQDVTSKKGLMETMAICGSPIACSIVNAYLQCDCECDPDTNTIAAKVTLNIVGTIYYYSGPFGAVKKTRDKSVVNARTAIDHEYNAHINPAIHTVEPLIFNLENTPFFSKSDCMATCNAVSSQVQALFAQTLGATQQKELSRP